MAKSHTPEGYTNPEVRFERADIDSVKVVRFATILGLTLLAAALVAYFVGLRLARGENRVKVTDLPPDYVDLNPKTNPGAKLPPQPRLEGIDDVRDQDTRNFELYPARAAEILRREERLLEKGDAKEGIEPIGEAISRLAGKLPARKRPAPPTFGVDLPSKASSGRAPTGGGATP